MARSASRRLSILPRVVTLVMVTACMCTGCRPPSEDDVPPPVGESQANDDRNDDNNALPERGKGDLVTPRPSDPNIATILAPPPTVTVATEDPAALYSLAESLVQGLQTRDLSTVSSTFPTPDHVVAWIDDLSFILPDQRQTVSAALKKRATALPDEISAAFSRTEELLKRMNVDLADYRITSVDVAGFDEETDRGGYMFFEEMRLVLAGPNGTLELATGPGLKMHEKWYFIRTWADPELTPG